MSWLGLLFLGVVQLGISYALYSEAIRHVSALEAILIPGIEPILNPVWVFLMLGERPGKWALVGGFVVLISVTLRSLIAVRRKDVSF
jgi:drug/metabolite transporter (DMT)-like permease